MTLLYQYTFGSLLLCGTISTCASLCGSFPPPRGQWNSCVSSGRSEASIKTVAKKVTRRHSASTKRGKLFTGTSSVDTLPPNRLVQHMDMAPEIQSNSQVGGERPTACFGCPDNTLKTAARTPSHIKDGTQRELSRHWWCDASRMMLQYLRGTNYRYYVQNHTTSLSASRRG